MKKQLVSLAALLVFACLSASPGRAQEPFYKDKTVTIIAGLSEAKTQHWRGVERAGQGSDRSATRNCRADKKTS